MTSKKNTLVLPCPKPEVWPSNLRKKAEEELSFEVEIAAEARVWTYLLALLKVMRPLSIPNQITTNTIDLCIKQLTEILDREWDKRKA